MRKPLRCRCTTSPPRSSRRKASRIGLRLVPKRCSRSCSRRGCPGLKVPSTMSSRICSFRKYGIVAGALTSNMNSLAAGRRSLQI
ncbi:Uncharacterised protein [Bordetella pertussis]|nr:Uncharacterised protein [Bordetella pertussis]